jgi:hypothetical protein
MSLPPNPNHEFELVSQDGLLMDRLIGVLSDVDAVQANESFSPAIIWTYKGMRARKPGD